VQQNDPAQVRAAVRRKLSTKAGMAAFLNQHVGREKWVYDADSDCWVFANPRHSGPGRGFVVIRRGGDWHTHVLPEDALS
jgi:hypothetical protein